MIQIKNTIKSPLRYPGGKSKSVKFIAPLIPKDFDEFREPFVGGGSVFIHFKQQYPERQFWINDLYPELYTFWKEVKKNSKAVLRQVKEWKNDFQNGKDLHRYLKIEIKDFPPAQKAAAFFVLNRITFSGTSESGGFSEHAFEKRFTQSSIQRLEKLAPLLKKVKITNKDYQKIIEAPGQSPFIFLDPPYYSATNSALYGKNGNLHKSFDHERFAKVMRKCNHPWLITYDDSPYIRDLFSFANIKVWNLTYGMRNVSESRQKAQEIFISNYKI